MRDQLIKRAQESLTNGELDLYIKTKTSAVPVTSRLYKAGQIVRSTDPWKLQDECVFVSSIRWSKSKICSGYGGYVVIRLSTGTMHTTTNVKPL